MTQEIKLRYRVMENKNEEITGSIITGMEFCDRHFTCIKMKNGVRYVPVENIISIDTKRKIQESKTHDDTPEVMHG